MGVRVIMAGILAVALVEGGTVVRAGEPPVSTWFYTTSDNAFASGGAGDASAQLLSRFSQGDAAGLPAAFEGSSLFGRDIEVAAPLAENLALEFGSRFANRFDFGSSRDGLFLTAGDFMQPFSGMNREMHAQSAIGLGNGLSLNLGESFGEKDSLTPDFGPGVIQTPLAGAGLADHTAQTSFAGLNWNVAPWASFGLVARQGTAQTSASNAVQSNLSLAKVSMQTLGASGRIAFGRGWVTSFSYNEGITQLDLRPAANLLSEESVRGRSYSVAIAKHGLFGDDALGFAVSQPMPSAAGSIDLDETPLADPFDGFISSATRPILGGNTPETDLQLGYVTTFLDGALALQANAGYQLNTAGQSGNNGVAVLSRAKINF